MSETIENLMDRLKSLKEYSVSVEIPESLSLRGVIPFDTTISGTKGTFKVIAASQSEADSKVSEFLSQQQ